MKNRIIEKKLPKTMKGLKIVKDNRTILVLNSSYNGEKLKSHLDDIRNIKDVDLFHLDGFLIGFIFINRG
jgi:hypothetical protein